MLPEINPGLYIVPDHLIWTVHMQDVISGI